jgi:long-chain fatty acid transport protein
MRRRPWRATCLGLLALGFWTAAPAVGAGFGFFEQGAKAMGMAGAFTAQADDPSALFHNPGGLAFFDERQLAAGFSWIYTTEAEFAGAPPFPGPQGGAEQETLSQGLPHLYWVEPVSDVWKLGLGVYAPFGLVTEWQDPGNFAGRYLSTKAALRAIDVNPILGWQLTPKFGLGIGAIARFSDVELHRYIATQNPFTLLPADVGKLELKSDFHEGFGWNVGFLHRYNNSFSWGLSYRSKVKVDYEGDARVRQIATGNAQFDALVRSRLPFDRDLPVQTSIEFPDMASLGFAIALTRNLLLETDFNWSGWSTFDEVVIDFTGGATNSLPDSTIPEDWDDVNNYRVGLRWTRGAASEWRFGYVLDKTPQPEEAVSPLLPDADRDGITIGYGRRGGRFATDVALMYLKFDDRTRARSFENEGAFFGTYSTTAWLLGLTVGF